MKIVWNVLLGIFAVLCLAVSVLQGFALPELAPWIVIALRIAAAFFSQWLFCRAFSKIWLRTLPILLTSLAAVWGYFLYLTSPSWRNATFGAFLSDYASLTLSCAAFWGLRWLLPRLLPRLKHAVKARFQKRKKAKVDKKDMPRFR